MEPRTVFLLLLSLVVLSAVPATGQGNATTTLTTTTLTTSTFSTVTVTSSSLTSSSLTSSTVTSSSVTSSSVTSSTETTSTVTSAAGNITTTTSSETLSTSTATTTASWTATTTAAAVETATRVQVQGQSGKFTVYDEAQGPSGGIQITMDALREVDAGGVAVGTAGAVKHSINTFAAQSFTIEAPEDVMMGSVPATKVSFASPISSIGAIKVDTYVLTGNGEVGPPGERWSASVGDLKWNIEVSNWTWCGCAKGQQKQTGAYIDLDVSVKGRSNVAQTGNLVDLGAGMGCELSDQVLVDGVWQQMPKGFPRVQLQGSQVVFTFRFPFFTDRAMYDPLITGVSSQREAEGGDNVTQAANTTAEPNSTTTSIQLLTNWTSTTTPSNAPPAFNTKVDILGQSGKFRVYDELKGRDSGIQVVMDALREVDASGLAVGVSGPTKHSIQSFATQNFTIAKPEVVTLGTVPATLVSFESPISDVGSIKVDTYVLGSSGVVGPPGEQWSVSPGDLKWNVVLSNWTWCGCGKGNSVEIGAYVDLDITLQGLAGIKEGKDSKHLDLGGNMACELSNQVQVDGTWVQMPNGFPTVVVKGSQVTLSFRFPRFSDRAMYDPLLTGISSAETTSSQPTSTATTTVTAVGAGSTATLTTSSATTTVSSGGPSSSRTTTTVQQPSQVMGMIDLAVPNCTAFSADPKVKASLATSLANTTGLSADNVRVEISCSRRLGVVPDHMLPRLLESVDHAIVAYTITVPTSGGASQATAVAHAIESETPATLTQKIETAMKDAGLSILVSVASIAAPVISAPATTVEPRSRDSDDPVSAASKLRIAALPSAVIAALATASVFGLGR